MTLLPLDEGGAGRLQLSVGSCWPLPADDELLGPFIICISRSCSWRMSSL